MPMSASPTGRKPACFIPSFAGLVVVAGSLNPIPSRTRPLNFPAPMVVRLKTRESRSLPGLPRTEFLLHDIEHENRRGSFRGGFFLCPALFFSLFFQIG